MCQYNEDYTMSVLCDVELHAFEQVHIRESKIGKHWPSTAGEKMSSQKPKVNTNIILIHMNILLPPRSTHTHTQQFNVWLGFGKCSHILHDTSTAYTTLYWFSFIKFWFDCQLNRHTFICSVCVRARWAFHAHWLFSLLVCQPMSKCSSIFTFPFPWIVVSFWLWRVALIHTHSDCYSRSCSQCSIGFA